MRNWKGIVLLLCVVLSAAALVACGPKQAANLIMMHDKGGNPNYQPFYEKVGVDAKAAIGVGVGRDAQHRAGGGHEVE